MMNRKAKMTEIKRKKELSKKNSNPILRYKRFLKTQEKRQKKDCS